LQSVSAAPGRGTLVEIRVLETLERLVEELRTIEAWDRMIDVRDECDRIGFEARRRRRVEIQAEIKYVVGCDPSKREQCPVQQAANGSRPCGVNECPVHETMLALGDPDQNT
jgi:hypothetical protein